MQSLTKETALETVLEPNLELTDEQGAMPFDAAEVEEAGAYCVSWDDPCEFCYEGYAEQEAEYEACLAKLVEEDCRDNTADEETANAIDIEAMGELGVFFACDVDDEETSHIVYPFVAAGKGTMIQGDCGVGKTALTIKLAADASKGRGFMGHVTCKKCRVLIISGEDSAAEIRKMLEANDADMSCCMICCELAGITLGNEKFNRLLDVCKPNLVVVDPLQAFLGSTVNMDKANQTRPVLTSVFEKAKEIGCGIVFVAHTGKSRADKAKVNQSLGSVDIPAAMRNILAVDAASDGSGDVIIKHIKCSYAAKSPDIRYRIVENRGIKFIGYQGEARVEAKNTPLYHAIHSFAEEKGGCTVTYDELNERAFKEVGSRIGALGVIRSQIDGAVGIALRNDGIVVRYGAKCRSNKAGVEISSLCR